MKYFVLLAIACLFVTVDAQVHCRNAGSLVIPASPCCGQVQGRGLAGALAEFFNLMDLECMLDIFFSAIIEDAEVTAFFNYITGPEFRVMILAVQNLQEFRDFMEYMCFNLQLDTYLYLNTLGDILGTPRIPHPEGNHCHPEFPFPFVTQKVEAASPLRPQRAAPSSIGGVRGLFDSLQAEIPNDAIYAMWTRKIASDPYLCPGYLKLSSPAFRAVALKMEFHPEFIRFVQKLEEWGVRMNNFMDNLKDFLWYSDYCR